MVKLTFYITPAAWELLCKLRIEGAAEYRDTEYQSLEEFKQSNLFTEGLRTEEWFLSRNFGGTYYLIDELTEYNLVDVDIDSWHVTYRLTKSGHKVLENEF